MSANFEIFSHLFSLAVGLFLALGPKWAGIYSDKRRMLLRIMGTIMALIALVQLNEDFKIF